MPGPTRWRSKAVGGATPPPRALWLRALLLERERIANHLGDLGFLGNDGGLAFGLAQFSRLKEDLLRAERDAVRPPLPDGPIVPGGVARDRRRDARTSDAASECDALRAEVRTLRAIYYDHAGLQDRFISCGRLAPRARGRSSGVVGLAGARERPRAGRARAARLRALRRARACAWRRTATATSPRASWCASRSCSSRCASQRPILEQLPARRDARSPLPTPPEGARGVGWVEGWRGEVLVALEAEPAARMRRCHPHDPSWQNWPALEHAVIGNIVPDFPLINKSFNLSYSGQDL